MVSFVDSLLFPANVMQAYAVIGQRTPKIFDENPNRNRDRDRTREWYNKGVGHDKLDVHRLFIGYGGYGFTRRQRD